MNLLTSTVPDNCANCPRHARDGGEMKAGGGTDSRANACAPLNLVLVMKLTPGPLHRRKITVSP
eukprot:11195465-Lingulodinium_polyedra.AAC.1